MFTIFMVFWSNRVLRAVWMFMTTQVHQGIVLVKFVLISILFHRLLDQNFMIFESLDSKSIHRIKFLRETHLNHFNHFFVHAEKLSSLSLANGCHLAAILCFDSCHIAQDIWVSKITTVTVEINGEQVWRYHA